MDSLTQIVLGAAAGELVLGKKIGNKAMLFGAIAGTIPDLDVIEGLFYQTISHRGFSHSFLFAFIMSPLLAWLMLKIFKDRKLSDIPPDNLSLWQKFQKRFLRSSGASFKDWTLLYFFCFVTHILLDVQTIYGTELLWPIKARLTTANIFIIDPLYTLPLASLLFAAIFFKRNTKARNGLVRTAFVVSVSYLALTFVFKGLSFIKFKQNIEEQNIAYTRIETAPASLNSILWVANVETDSAYYTGNYSLLDKDDKIKFRRMEKNFALRKELEGYKNFDRLNHFAKNWYLLRKAEDSTVYYYDNIRFGSPIYDHDEPSYIFSYKLEKQDNTLAFEENFGREEMSGKASEILRRLWRRVLGEK